MGACACGGGVGGLGGDVVLLGFEKGKMVVWVVKIECGVLLGIGEGGRDRG